MKLHAEAVAISGGGFSFECGGEWLNLDFESLKFALHLRKKNVWGSGFIPIGPKVVPFWGSYIEFYKVIPKRSYFGAYG